jgi:hypothetical protein
MRQQDIIEGTEQQSAGQPVSAGHGVLCSESCSSQVGAGLRAVPTESHQRSSVPAKAGIIRGSNYFSAGHGVDRLDSISARVHRSDRAPDTCSGPAPTDSHRRLSAFIGGQFPSSAGHGVDRSDSIFASSRPLRHCVNSSGRPRLNLLRMIELANLPVRDCARVIPAGHGVDRSDSISAPRPRRTAAG